MKPKKILDVFRHKKTKDMEDGPAKAVCAICREDMESQCKLLEKAAADLRGYTKYHEQTAAIVLGNTETDASIIAKERTELEKKRKAFQDAFDNLLKSYLGIEYIFNESFDFKAPAINRDYVIKTYGYGNKKT